MLTDEFKEGRFKSVVVPQNIDAVRELIMQDRHVTYREIKTFLDKFLKEEERTTDNAESLFIMTMLAVTRQLKQLDCGSVLVWDPSIKLFCTSSFLQMDQNCSVTNLQLFSYVVRTNMPKLPYFFYNGINFIRNRSAVGLHSKRACALACTRVAGLQNEQFVPESHEQPKVSSKTASVDGLSFRVIRAQVGMVPDLNCVQLGDKKKKNLLKIPNSVSLSMPVPDPNFPGGAEPATRNLCAWYNSQRRLSSCVYLIEKWSARARIADVATISPARPYQNTAHFFQRPCEAQDY
ncbi:hypothetical protein EVAR_80670_1 [Eumeta japonica]|uniref:Uncharacterized protein n=1 Tax=Eumeta variegata TaxID=151549 RepID=A0A4C1U384_EUMVA|nr:hypothetical protein EVAR_80670_1 [Eumeta japonica]